MPEPGESNLTGQIEPWDLHIERCADPDPDLSDSRKSDSDESPDQPTSADGAVKKTAAV